MSADPQPDLPDLPKGIPIDGAPGANRAYQSGTIRVASGRVKIPTQLSTEDNTEFTILGFEPVVVVILCGAISFIAFIAYLISQSPLSIK